ncbi:LCP family protein [Streptomyces sp. NPDC005438]|uniref:LCP family protein n=1 Tax=Streptomyces sp. NPDC005438 TaxID=3156880 RepID=UPI0033B2131E
MPHQAGGVPAQSRGYDDVYGSQNAPGYDSGYSEGRVYGGDSGWNGGQGGPPPGYDERPQADWGRRLKVGAVVLVLVLLVWSIGTYAYAESKLRDEVDLGKVEDRPEAGEGTNYLIVGSDSREGMTKEDQKRLHTGAVDGQRTDSMIILHVGDNGNTMVSLPRDSWVTIPEFTGSDSGNRIKASKNKLNAAYSMEGPWLLTRTVEYNTGLKIDHYAEIGFGGFAKIVDAVGGVEMDIPEDIKDRDSGADLKKGKQTLNGADALAFVRNRKQAGSDLVRTQNQQKFLSALANQTATPSTILNPFRLYPTMSAGLDSLVVDSDMGVWTLGKMFWAMKGVSGGDGKQLNMPTTSTPAPMGSLQWDMPKVKQLVSQLKNDEKVTVSSQ